MDWPYLLFLQGGPGIQATRPTSPPVRLDEAGHRGLPGPAAGPAGNRSLHPGRAGGPGGPPPREQADYLARFHAPPIVLDAEHIRRELEVTAGSVLGQSFGGFTTMTYLSLAPEGLRGGDDHRGLSPVGRPPDDVYAATGPAAGREEPGLLPALPGRPGAGGRDPGAPGLVSRTSACPSGGRLTPRRFRQLGIWLGDSAGCELLHHLLDLLLGLDRLPLRHRGRCGSARNPIYATLHESTYADGVPTRWSAAPHLARPRSRRAVVHRRARLFVDVGGLRLAAGAPGPAELLPSFLAEAL